MTLFLFRPFIHPSFHAILERMNFGDRLSFLVVHTIDRLKLWHRLPVILGLLYLERRRHLHETYNLLLVGEPDRTRFDPDKYRYRTDNGEYNDPESKKAGSQLTFFGRNMSPIDRKDEIMSPDPLVVATKLLARRSFKDTGKQFNLIAASWIQFMVHDWIDHLEDTQQAKDLHAIKRFTLNWLDTSHLTDTNMMSEIFPQFLPSVVINLRDLQLRFDDTSKGIHSSCIIIEITAPFEVASECPLKSFKFYKTKLVPTNAKGITNGHLNIRTPWWDGSVIYGSDVKKATKMRTFVDGKLHIGRNNLLQHNYEEIALSGDIRNSWAGVSVLQALFIKEHNAVCDALKAEYPNLNDEELYHYARLVTSAVIAKIHTIDWTVELLKTDTLNAGMHANWYGLLGKRIKDTFGHIGGSTLGGLVGLKKPNNHGVPYSLTEEFVSVYRMHSLLPDTLTLRNINSNPGQNKSPDVLTEIKMEEMVGRNGESSLASIGFERQMVSMGHQACGALELWNYPLFLRDLIPDNVDGSARPDHVDMPALEVYRDRERDVPRYNQFRRGLLMIPISKWEDLTDDTEAIDALREVYGDDVEKLDLLVGLMAEKKIKGFAISETAFFIFLIMASRRLEADRFFTSYFNADTYTKKGLEWVNKTESLREVIHRHYPDMTTKWMNSTSAFSVWDAPPNKYNLIPLYLRIPS